MDSIMAVAGLPTARKGSTNSFNFHSTDPIISTLSTLAHDSLQDHINDYADAHRWIDSFFQKLDLRGSSAGGGTASRPTMSELMKTPGRKRVVGTNSTNHSTPSIQAAAKKDPLATLLFPIAPALDKENNLASPVRTSTPKRVLSPASVHKSSGIPLSPMRIGSPRPTASSSRTQSIQPRAPLRAPTLVTSPAPVIARDFAQAPVKTLSQLQEEIEHDVHGDLSNVMEEDEDQEEEVREPAQVSAKKEPSKVASDSAESTGRLAVDSREASIVAAEDEKAGLCIISEEEEEEREEDEQVEEKASISRASTDKPAPARIAETSSFVAAETQISVAAVTSPSRAKIAAIPSSLPVPVLSPQSRSVSGASSVAPDADDDESVPLNDGPSALRSTSADGSLSSSLPASSNTRTPGGSSRFAAVGSYSAAKIGMGSLNIGSSPPTASTSTFAGPSHNFRISSGGTQQLNFVGLPKKSMGLQLGRNWANSNSSASDSQGSSQGRLSFATAATSTSIDISNSGSTTSSGAMKRKSLTGPDVSSKVAKVARGSEVGGDQPRSKIEQLHSRMQNLQARASAVAGSHRMSNASTFASSTLFPNTSKSLSGSSSSAFSSQPQQPLVSSIKPAPLVAPLPPSTSSASVANPLAIDLTSTAPSSGPVRRPSVMERVKSFEYASTTQDHLNPPSPSKIPSAFNRSVSPVPPHSPRGLASPTFAPSSPRPMTRSATSGLPLSKIGSPKMASSSSFSPMMGSPKPIPSSFYQSPPVAISVPSVPLTSFRAPPAPIPAPASLPLAAASPPRLDPIVRSTTPPGSPPSLDTFQSIFQRFAVPPTLPQRVEPSAVPSKKNKVEQKKESIVVNSDEDEEQDDYGQDEEDQMEEADEEEEEEEEEEEIPSIRPVKTSTTSFEQERAERAQAKAIAQRAREIEEEEAEREREEAAKKRLPSLPEPQLLTKDDSEEEEEEEAEDDEEEEVIEGQSAKEKTIVKKATKENLQTRTSPSKIVMPGTFGAALVAASSNQNSPHESENEDNEEDVDGDKTTMSIMSTATSTFNFAQPQGAFRPTKPSTMPKQRSNSSLASSVSSTTALGLNQSIGNGASKKTTAAAKVKNAQTAAAAAKKEKEEAERKKMMRDLQERRLQVQKKKQELEQKKQETERRAKAEELEKKRKDREEALAKAKANAARIVAKQKAVEEENSKKRKMEQDTKVPLKKAATQSSRPMATSSSSHRISSLATSQGRNGVLAPVNPLSKSGGASSMIGQKFMSNQIRLPETSANAQASSSTRPPAGSSTTIPKPFGLSASQGSIRPAAPQASALRPPPSAHKPDPEPYQELPEIDSEYSDSDDEAHEKKVAAFPRWAQSPVLTHQLLEQRKINPDDIFGPIPALSIADMFRNSQSTARLRVRTSSAQWDGTDALTRTDMDRYHRAMGFTKTTASTSVASTSSGAANIPSHEHESHTSQRN